MIIKTPFLLEVGFCVYDISISIVGVNITDIGYIFAKKDSCNNIDFITNKHREIERIDHPVRH